jgi:hypothetical protein
VATIRVLLRNVLDAGICMVNASPSVQLYEMFRQRVSLAEHYLYDVCVVTTLFNFSSDRVLGAPVADSNI